MHEIKKYKKVLLRECKRHTDRGVSSTPSVSWSGVPPPARSDRGGYPRWVTPHCQEVSLLERSDGGGYPRWGTTRAGPGLGTPRPPPSVDRQMDGWMDGWTRVKTLPSRRTTYEVGNKLYQDCLFQDQDSPNGERWQRGEGKGAPT